MKTCASLMVFLFVALSLIVPSGYSYGSLCLCILGITTLLRGRFPRLYKQDWILLSAILLYVIVDCVLVWFHHLPLSAVDKTSRYLFVIPVYVLLIAYPPIKKYFWMGLIVGAAGVGILAIFQQLHLFIKPIWPGRSSGFMNPIQFGDISLLMSMLLLPFIIDFYESGSKHLAMMAALASLLGFLASILSLTRGGWLAIPVVTIIFCVLIRKGRSTILYSFLAFTMFVIVTLCIPSSNFVKDRVLSTYVDVLRYSQNERLDVHSSIGSRVQMWKNGVMAFNARPYVGWGDVNAMKEGFPSQWAELNSVDDFNHLHNDYIDVLAKRGLLGFVSLFLLYLIPMSYFIRLVRSKRDKARVFATAGIIFVASVIVFGLTQCFLAHISGTMIFAFYLVIIMAYCRDLERQELCTSSDLI